MRIVLWVVALLCAGYGAIDATWAIALANGAPQQAAGAAMGIAWAVIPYCAARAWTELRPPER